MQPDEQLYIARLVREQRGHIEDTVRELVERQTPLSELEGRLLAYNSTSLLAEIEYRLRQDVLDQHRLQPSGSSPLYRRIRGLTVPKIGRLHHYLPRVLRVPQAYLRTAAPPDPPTISIVTPSFQQGRYVGRTIFSVVNQQYPALEYIVQDGGSTDGTLDVLQRFDGDLTCWVSEPDLGQADAINRAFDRTTGEIMAWLNSDDLVLPGTLAYVGSYFARHPEVDVVYGNRMLIDENDGDIGVWVLPKHDDRMLTNIDYVPQETLFWRRRIWDSSGGRIDPGFDYALDWDLLLRFRQAGAKIVRLPRFLGAFRVHDEQKTTAQDRVGAAECARLRERVHGRPVSHEEAVGQTVSYLRRHLLAHARYRLGERLSQPGVEVLTTPPSIDPPQPNSGIEAKPSAPHDERQVDALPSQYARRMSEKIQDAHAVEQNKDLFADG